MINSKIDQFFTPSRSGKRQRPYSSPDSIDSVSSMSENEKVGDLTQGQLMIALSTLLDSKISNLATKDDLVFLSSQIHDLTEENRQLQQKVGLLEREQGFIKAKLIDLEGRARRNNLIFRGLKWDRQTKDFKHLVRRFCADQFGSEDRLYVNRAHPLGKGNAIIAHIPDDADIEYIMSRVKNLKGTGYTVHRDFPSEVREKRACLAAVRAEVERVAGRRRMPLYFDHLTVEGTRFTWEEGKLRVGREDGVQIMQTLIHHDLTDFIRRLSENGPERPRRETPAASQHQQQHPGPANNSQNSSQAQDQTQMH